MEFLPRYLLALKLSTYYDQQIKQKVTSKRLKIWIEILAVLYRAGEKLDQIFLKEEWSW